MIAIIFIRPSRYSEDKDMSIKKDKNECQVIALVNIGIDSVLICIEVYDPRMPLDRVDKAVIGSRS